MRTPTDFKKVKHFHEPGHLHEFTFCCYHNLPLLSNNSWRETLSRSIDLACTICQIELVAFVYMLEHVHLLVLPLLKEPELDSFLYRVKQPVSVVAKKSLVDAGSNLLQKLTVQERPGKKSFRFWQEGPGYDRNVFSPQSVASSIDYIHDNPVRRGLCRCAVDWKWSSARHYLLEPPKQQFAELPFIHGLRPEAFEPSS